jgi:hypothetical protein
VNDLDVPRCLAAVRAVESGDRTQLVGSDGELGAYQFKEITWRQHTSLPFRYATDRVAADRVAARHLRWLTQELRRYGFTVSVFHVELAWNLGFAGFLRGPRSWHAVDLAERAQQLYDAT